MRNFLFVLFVSLTSVAFAGTTDSLRQELNKERMDSIRIRLMLEIGDSYELSSPDSQIYFYQQAAIAAWDARARHWNYKQLYAAATRYSGIYYSSRGDFEKGLFEFKKSFSMCRNLTEESEADAIKEGQLGLSMSLINIAGIQYYTGDHERAANNYMAALYLKKLLKDKKGMALCINNIGNVYMARGQYDVAMRYFQQSVDQYRSFKDTLDEKLASDARKGMSMGLMNMGIIKRNLNDYESAIDYYQQAVDLRIALKDFKGVTECYLNMGVAYKYFNEHEKALMYYDKAMMVFERLGDKKGIIRCLNNMGVLYFETNELKKAEDLYLKSLAIAEESGDKPAVAHINNNLSDIYIKTKEYDKALTCAKKAQDVAATVSSLAETTRAYYELMEGWAGKGNYKLAYENAKQHIVTNDSLKGVEKAKTIQEMEAKYQAEKKQQEIDKQNLELTKKEEAIKRKEAETAFQKTLSFALLGGLLLVVLLAYFIYRGYRQKKKVNEIISYKNGQLEQANTEITAQRDEIEAQRDTLDSQKNQLEIIHNDQTDSIRYAQRIQKALIPSEDMLKEMMIADSQKAIADFFVLFRPRNIVSGDFYWSVRVDNRLIFCVADCTGHGVPGAFMSMLGLSYLNEIAKRHIQLSASEMLNELRASIVVSLRQQINDEGKPLNEFNPGIPINRDSLHDVKDGMDISLCILNTDTMQLQFAGANNSLYLLKSRNIVETKTLGEVWPVAGGLKSSEIVQPLFKTSASAEIEDSPLTEFKGDKMPIGVYLRMQPFTQQDIHLEPGDCIYMMSDGLQDQFGGKDYKKFSSRRLRNLLIDVSGKNMQEQKKAIEKEFNDWKGKYQQLDDICILGIRAGK